MAFPTITVETVEARYPALTLDESVVEAMLPHAVDLITYHIVAAYAYTHVETNTRIANAVCDQVAHWLEFGETGDLADYPVGTVIRVGELSYPVPPTLAPRAARQLALSGLTTPHGA